MILRLSIISILGLVLSSSIRSETLEFLNKLTVPVEIVLGTKNNPPRSTSSTIVVQPGSKYSQQVDPAIFPQLGFKELNKDMGIIYEFSSQTPNTPLPQGTNIYVRLVDGKNNLLSLEPQTFILKKNVSKDTIKLAGTFGRMTRQLTPTAQQPSSPKMPGYRTTSIVNPIEPSAPSLSRAPSIASTTEPATPSLSRNPSMSSLTGPASPSSMQSLEVPEAPPFVPQAPSLIPQAPPLGTSGVPQAPPLMNQSQVNTSSSDRTALLQDIQQGKKLNPTSPQPPQPVDDRGALLKQIQAGTTLKKTTDYMLNEINALSPSQKQIIKQLSNKFDSPEIVVAQAIKTIAPSTGETGRQLKDINFNNPQLQKGLARALVLQKEHGPDLDSESMESEHKIDANTQKALADAVKKKFISLNINDEIANKTAEYLLKYNYDLNNQVGSSLAYDFIKQFISSQQGPISIKGLAGKEINIPKKYQVTESEDWD